MRLLSFIRVADTPGNHPFTPVLPRILCALLISHSLLVAQQAPAASSQVQPVVDMLPLLDTGIPGLIADGTPAVPAPLPEPLQFSVKRTLTSRRQVTEAPEIPGLPAVQGTINITVQLVEDPGLPDPPPPVIAQPMEAPAAVDGTAELSESGPDCQLVYVSATVFDHARTYVRCGLGNGKEIVGWSNIDFNHFTGVGTYQVKGSDGILRQYSLMMGIGDEETAGSGGELTPAPTLPVLATSGPAFVITEGDTTDKESMDLFVGLHDLYRVEGARMAAACQGRAIAYEARKTYLLANPPVPKDVTIQFWKRETPSPAGMNALTKGAKP